MGKQKKHHGPEEIPSPNEYPDIIPQSDPEEPALPTPPDFEPEENPFETPPEEIPPPDDRL